MRILPGDPAALRPWVLTAGMHQLKVKLSPASRRVRAGTPLRPTSLGWEACPAEVTPWGFSADYKMPGDEVNAWREVTIDTGHILGTPGTRLRISDIGDDGALTLEKDENGPHVVLWDSYVLFTLQPPVSTEAIAAGILASLRAQQEPDEPEPDYLNKPDLE